MTNDLPNTSRMTTGRRAARLLNPTVVLTCTFLGAVGAGFGCGAADETDAPAATEEAMQAIEGPGQPGEIRRGCEKVRQGVKRCGWYVCETESGVALPRRDPNDPYNKRPDPLTASCSWVPLSSPDPVDAVYCCQGQRTDENGKTVYTRCTKFSNPEKGRIGKNRCGHGINFAQPLEVECNNTSAWDVVSGDVYNCG